MILKRFVDILVLGAAFIAIENDFSGVHATSVDENNDLVTCGSAIKLLHIKSQKYFLKSSVNQQYGPGSSGQQVVTLAAAKKDPDTLWQIREAHNATACQIGSPVQCGDTIRLTHVNSGRNLHSHNSNLSPLSRNNEVTAFGVDGEGDASDNWTVECVQVTSDQRGNTHDIRKKFWEKKTLIRLHHDSTGGWLSGSTSQKYNNQNCPHCPILGELEVAGKNRMDESSILRVEDGAFFHV